MSFQDKCTRKVCETLSICPSVQSLRKSLLNNYYASNAVLGSGRPTMRILSKVLNFRKLCVLRETNKYVMGTKYYRIIITMMKTLICFWEATDSKFIGMIHRKTLVFSL